MKIKTDVILENLLCKEWAKASTSDSKLGWLLFGNQILGMQRAILWTTGDYDIPGSLCDSLEFLRNIAFARGFIARNR